MIVVNCFSQQKCLVLKELKRIKHKIKYIFVIKEIPRQGVILHTISYYVKNEDSDSLIGEYNLNKYILL